MEFGSQVRYYLVSFFVVLISHLGPLCFWTKIENLNRSQSRNVSGYDRVNFFRGQQVSVFVGPCGFFEERFHVLTFIYKKRVTSGTDPPILFLNTPMESHRDQKRQSSKKNSDYTVYTKKAVRAKEALLEKKLSCPANPGKK